MMRPAKNAPRASESPSDCVAQAAAKHSTTTVMMKSSLFLPLATARNKRGTANRPLTYTPTTSTTIFTNSRNRSPLMSLLLPASMGVTSIMGTTRMSWKIRMAALIRPKGASMRPCSWSMRSTMAVLLRVTRKPVNTAAGRERPNMRPTPVTSPIVSKA